MTIECLIPQETSELAALIGQVRSAPGSRPFCEQTVEFVNAFASLLARDSEARSYPELAALAFWMRKTELVQLAKSFGAMESDTVVRAPRGVVFHVPPANVDVMFVYSWLLSLLCGNRNIVRLSKTRGPVTDILIRVLRTALANSAPPGLRLGNLFVTYGHEEAFNSELSKACDTRVVWGGDESIRIFRRFDIQPLATEVVFPDRFSLAALSAAAVLDLDEQGIAGLAERFYSDAFWFHQLACSSPTLVIWCGAEDACSSAGDRFYASLAGVVRAKGYHLPPAARISRFTFECAGAIDLPVLGRRDFGAALTTVRLADLSAFDRRHCGGGLFFEYYAPRLAEVTPFLSRKDQTLGHFGFEPCELRELALELNGKGVDRIVPVGSALRFSRYWDGMDLLAQLTRCVIVEP